MFDNSGEKLKVAVTTLASLLMGLFVIAGVICFVGLAGSNFLLALVALIVIAGLGCLGVWLSFMLYAAIADIAINTERTAYLLEEMQRKANAPSAASSVVPPASVPAASVSRPSARPSYGSAAGQPQGKIPAWKRIEMEEAAKKQEQ